MGQRLRTYAYAAWAAALVSCCAIAGAAEPAPFTSDGCSLFPDGTPADRAKWCDCCLRHDIAYWQGGTEEERKRADAELRDCVLRQTGDKALAETMYLGVRAGGHPAFPAWYRWGYGWPYGRGYRSLTPGERAAADAEETAYRAHNRDLRCTAPDRDARSVP